MHSIFVIQHYNQLQTRFVIGDKKVPLAMGQCANAYWNDSNLRSSGIVNQGFNSLTRTFLHSLFPHHHHTVNSAILYFPYFIGCQCASGHHSARFPRYLPAGASTGLVSEVQYVCRGMEQQINFVRNLLGMLLLKFGVQNLYYPGSQGDSAYHSRVRNSASLHREFCMSRLKKASVQQSFRSAFQKHSV